MDMDMMRNSKNCNTTAVSTHQPQQQDAIDAVEQVSNVKQPRRQQAASSDGVQNPRPQPEVALKCPRCDSNKTKFCYYNNYNKSQPRYFCKVCRRYWTQGGTLRNVPIGGARRKNKRSFSSASPSSSDTITRMINNNLPSLSAPTNFPNVLPTFMSSSFELSMPLAPPLSLSGSLAPAPALAPRGSTTPAFLDLLREEFLDHHGSGGFFGPTHGGNKMEMSLPPSFGFNVRQHGIVDDHYGVASIGGSSETATTQLGGHHNWEGTQHGHNNDDASGARSNGLQ